MIILLFTAFVKVIYRPYFTCDYQDSSNDRTMSSSSIAGNENMILMEVVDPVHLETLVTKSN